MKGYYFPTRLREERMVIEREMEGKAEFNSEEDGEDSIFYTFLKKISTSTTDKALAFAEKCEKEMIEKLADYVTINKYKFKSENMLAVLYKFADAEDWKTILVDWENKTNNVEVKRFLGLGLENLQCQEMLKLVGVTSEKFSWIKSEDVVESICKSCTTVTNNEQFVLQMEKKGVFKDTILFSNCVAQFFLYCSRSAYLSFGDTKLSEKYRVFDENERVQLLSNLLSELSLSDLDDFVGTYKVHKNYSNTNFKQKLLLKLNEKGLNHKYKNWTDRMEITIGFEGDSYRIAFWLKYQPGNYVNSEDTNVLFIDFGKMVITEFKGKAAGPCYIMDKGYFEVNVHNKIKYWSKTDLQKYLHDQYESSAIGMHERLVHIPPYGGWMWEFERVLRKYGIRPSNV